MPEPGDLRVPEGDRRQVLAGLEAALTPWVWVDADGLRVVAADP